MRAFRASACPGLAAAAPLVAEEPCPPDRAGPRLTYAANTLRAMYDNLGGDRWHREDRPDDW